MRTQDGFYVILYRMFSFYKNSSTKVPSKKVPSKKVPSKKLFHGRYFLFSRIYFFIGSLSLISRITKFVIVKNHIIMLLTIYFTINLSN